MSKYTKFKLAAIQAAPVYLDRDASTEKACRLILEAGAKGATLAAFGETWLPGYPLHIFGPMSDAQTEMTEYLASAVKIPSPATDQLCEAARQANIDVVIGVAEQDPVTQGTVYCTLLFISNDGTILGRHRKLKPTHRERSAWGEGDGSSLRVYERPYGKISGLNCWEHNMVLPGYALMEQGTQIHISAWPGINYSRHLILSRAFASQAAAYVVAVGGIVLPEHFTVKGESEKFYAQDALGYSAIIDPTGEVIAGPVEGETILMAEGSTEQIFAAKALVDVGAHYSRPDIFQLHINRKSTARDRQTNVPDTVEPEIQSSQEAEWVGGSS